MATFHDVFKTIEKVEIKAKRMKPQLLHIDHLHESRFQYRNLTAESVQKLADLIAIDGEVLQPLIVRKDGADDYEILSGHKRFAACKYLCQTLDSDRFSFLPCYITDLDDIHAEFAVYSTNGYDVKSQYEIMKEIEGIKRLMQKYPDQFPKQARERMVDRIAREINLSKSTVIDYQNISKNLSTKAMEAFRTGEINKTAALALCPLKKETQDSLIQQGFLDVTSIKKQIQEEKKLQLNNSTEGRKKEQRVRKDVVKICSCCNAKLHPIYNPKFCGACGNRIN